MSYTDKGGATTHRYQRCKRPPQSRRLCYHWPHLTSRQYRPHQPRRTLSGLARPHAARIQLIRKPAWQRRRHGTGYVRKHPPGEQVLGQGGTEDTSHSHWREDGYIWCGWALQGRGEDTDYTRWEGLWLWIITWLGSQGTMDIGRKIEIKCTHCRNLEVIYRDNHYQWISWIQWFLYAAMM